MDEEAYSSSSSSSNPSFSNASSNSHNLFVKVYMEGNPIGRKLNLLDHNSYQDLVTALGQMFNTPINWGTELDAVQAERCHVLTYKDDEGNLCMVGDVAWGMFLSAVKKSKRLNITTGDRFMNRRR